MKVNDHLPKFKIWKGVTFNLRFEINKLSTVLNHTQKKQTIANGSTYVERPLIWAQILVHFSSATRNSAPARDVNRSESVFHSIEFFTVYLITNSKQLVCSYFDHVSDRLGPIHPPPLKYEAVLRPTWFVMHQTIWVTASWLRYLPTDAYPEYAWWRSRATCLIKPGGFDQSAPATS